MGTFSVRIEIGDAQGHMFQSVDALVDTGATLTSIPASMLERLGVESTRRGTFQLANGELVEMGLAETRVRVEGMETSTWVLFGAEDSPILLGAYTLEGLLLGVDPHNQRLIPVNGLLMAEDTFGR